MTVYCIQQSLLWHADILNVIFQFGSWTYDLHKVDLALITSVGDTSNYVPSTEWSLVNMTAVRTTDIHPCCNVTDLLLFDRRNQKAVSCRWNPVSIHYDYDHHSKTTIILCLHVPDAMHQLNLLLVARILPPV